MQEPDDKVCFKPIIESLRGNEKYYLASKKILDPNSSSQCLVVEIGEGGTECKIYVEGQTLQNLTYYGYVEAPYKEFERVYQKAIRYFMWYRKQFKGNNDK